MARWRYPTGSDYQTALQDPARCFADPVLKRGRPKTGRNGLPKPISGNVATVFDVRGDNGTRYALKCFTRHVRDQDRRYSAIGAALRHSSHAWQVDFEYQDEGITVNGVRYPLLKMGWADGRGVISYIAEHLSTPGAIRRVAGQFAEIVAQLTALGVAHGDLQHDNVLVTGSGLRLVDYDGMYVPGLGPLGANELGHLHYQSPQRTIADFGPHLDRFSAWVIYASLLALTHDYSLWSRLRAEGAESLLFQRNDYEDPSRSEALLALAQSRNRALAAIAEHIQGLCGLALGDVPPFDPGALPAPGDSVAPRGAPVPDALHTPTPRPPRPKFFLQRFKQAKATGQYDARDLREIIVDFVQKEAITFEDFVEAERAALLLPSGDRERITAWVVGRRHRGVGR